MADSSNNDGSSTPGPVDVVIAGCGPAGATSAILLAEKGFSVNVIERERFPRFQVGESLLPFNGAIFDRLGVREDLESGPHVAKYGAEFKTADDARATRFSFDRFLPDELHQAWQVRRADFDEMLMRRARAAGATIFEGWTVSGIERRDGALEIGVTNREGEARCWRGRFFIDASGAGNLSSRLGVERTDDPGLRKVALFAHYRGGRPAGEGKLAGNIVIVTLRDGWCWLIPLPDGLTSFGLVVDRDDLRRSESPPEELLRSVIERAPAVRARLGQAELASRVWTRKNFSFRVDRMWGEDFVLVGDAAGFVDPIFSTGVLVAMQSGEIAADAVEAKLRCGTNRELRRYERRMRAAVGRYRRIIRKFYQREFVEVFLNPQEVFGVIEILIRLLAGNAFEREPRRWKMELFYALVRLQRLTGSIAPSLPWDTLPGAFEDPLTEERVGRPTAETSSERATDRAAEFRGHGP